MKSKTYFRIWLLLFLIIKILKNLRKHRDQKKLFSDFFIIIKQTKVKFVIREYAENLRKTM